MVGKRLAARSRAAWELAGKQHGILSRRDLLGLGFDSRSIEHRVAIGRLHPVRHGIYAVGWPRLTPERRWMSAVLACDPEAALSHHSAAALWGIGKERRDRIDVSVRRHCYLRQQGIRARSRPSLPEKDIVLRNGIPVTRPARTLLDQATELTLIGLERAINDADKLDLIDPETLRDELEGYAGEPGVRVLRRLIDERTFRLSDSDLEIFFRPIATAAGLPLPLTKAWVNGFEVDFFWPDLALVVETDGLRFHRTPFAQSRDHLRDQTHTASGLSHLRFSHYEVRYKPAHVRRILTKTTRAISQRSQH